MPKPNLNPRAHPLTPDQAKRTLAQRLGTLGDNLRQLATNFGVRPYRCFLVWTHWGGAERGEGMEREVKRIEVLPTPRVTSLDNLSFSFFHAGTLPVGSVRVDRISVVRFSYDILTGKMVPTPHEDHIPEPYDFFWEIIEDGRGDNPALRSKFRVMSYPVRRAGKLDWTLMLERVSEDNNRYGQSQIGPDFPGPLPGLPSSVKGP
jgi:hypothetical protein